MSKPPRQGQRLRPSQGGAFHPPIGPKESDRPYVLPDALHVVPGDLGRTRGDVLGEARVRGQAASAELTETVKREASATAAIDNLTRRLLERGRRIAELEAAQAVNPRIRMLLADVGRYRVQVDGQWSDPAKGAPSRFVILRGTQFHKGFIGHPQKSLGFDSSHCVAQIYASFEEALNAALALCALDAETQTSAVHCPPPGLQPTSCSMCGALDGGTHRLTCKHATGCFISVNPRRDP